jgi:murein DD-endopeptidase MepM/ murein hydrolase activator NlpD
MTMPAIVPPLDPNLHPIIKAFSPQHQCLDFAASVGTPVVAAHAGRCAVLQPLAAEGVQLMIVSHDRLHRSLYSPLTAVCVVNGQQVEAGQTIAMTTTGPDGPRMHYRLTVDNIPVDPLPLFSEPIARSPYDRQPIAH